jgi:hypothetical protein
MFETTVDWLQGSVTLDTFEDFILNLCEFFDDVPVWSLGQSYSVGQRKYANHCRSARGLIFAWDSPEVDEPIRLWVSFRGSLLSQLSPENRQFLFLFLSEYSFECTRVDFALDDFNRLIKPSQLHKAIANHNFFNYDKATAISGSDRRDPHYSDGNFTFYFGSRQSSRFGRIYDKRAESEGQIEAVRLELEVKHKLARSYFQELLPSCNPNFVGEDSPFSILCRSFVLGAFDFRDRSKGFGSRLKCPPLPWWQKFVDRCEVDPIRLSPGRVRPSLEVKREWHRRQVAKSLAIFQAVDPAGFQSYVGELVSDGTYRLTKADRALVAVGKKDYPNGLRSIS